MIRTGKGLRLVALLEGKMPQCSGRGLRCAVKACFYHDSLGGLNCNVWFCWNSVYPLVLKVHLSLSHICCVSLWQLLTEQQQREALQSVLSSRPPATLQQQQELCFLAWPAGGLFWSCWEARDAQQHLEQALGQSSSRVFLKFQLWNELSLFFCPFTQFMANNFFNSPKIVLLKSLYEAAIATLGAQDAIRGDNRWLLTRRMDVLLQ